MEILSSPNQNRPARETFHPLSNFRERRPARFFIFCLWLALFYLGLNEARSQNFSSEYSLKAVFLFNFAQFTIWPTNAFASPDSPIVIGVLGDDPFGEVLEETVDNEQVNGRKFRVERYPHLEDIKNCQILFISHSETSHLDKIIKALKDKPILTVSGIENAANRGVCISFITENNKIRLRINTDSLKLANLTVSSKLLRVSEITPLPAP